jgi:hypothetical protein
LSRYFESVCRSCCCSCAPTTTTTTTSSSSILSYHQRIDLSSPTLPVILQCCPYGLHQTTYSQQQLRSSLLLRSIQPRPCHSRRARTLLGHRVTPDGCDRGVWVTHGTAGLCVW